MQYLEYILKCNESVPLPKTKAVPHTENYIFHHKKNNYNKSQYKKENKAA